MAEELAGPDRKMRGLAFTLLTATWIAAPMVVLMGAGVDGYIPATWSAAGLAVWTVVAALLLRRLLSGA